MCECSVQGHWAHSPRCTTTATTRRHHAFILHNWSCLPWTVTPHPHPWKPPFCILRLWTRSASHSCNHMIFVILWPVYFTWHDVLEVHVICVRIFFLSKARQSCIVCIDYILLLWSVDGSLGCFHIFPTVSDAAANMGTQVSLWGSAFNSCERAFRMAESMLALGLIFWGTAHCFPQQLHHFMFPPMGHKGSNISTSSLIPVVFYFLTVAILNGYEVAGWHPSTLTYVYTGI